jgi:hypothetical protein
MDVGGGWLVAMIDEYGKLSHLLLSSLNDLPDISPQLALIDIPLAFADQSYRPCEIAAQLLLGPKKKSVNLPNTSPKRGICCRLHGSEST